MTSGFSLIRKLFIAPAGEPSKSRKRHVEDDKDDKDSECGSPSRQKGTDDVERTLSELQSENSEI